MDLGSVEAWRPEVRCCPACGADRFARLGRRGGPSHHLGLGVETTIVRCRRCHLVYPRPFLLPKANPYESYVPEDYFHAHDPARKLAAGVSLARRATQILGRTGELLELGCGRGELLEGARQEGWRVSGVDMTPAFAGVRPELRVEIAPVDRARSLERTYDVVYLAAILEHVYEPADVLRRVGGALTDGGLVFIDVPNECSLWTRVGNAYMAARGRDWAVNLSPTFPPFHVVGFCPRSLRRLLERCGFSVVELRTHRWQNELPRRPGIRSGVERWSADAVLTLGWRLGMGAGITCWARKTRHPY